MTDYRGRSFRADDAIALTGKHADITEWAGDDTDETITYQGLLVTGYGKSWLTTQRPDGSPLNIFFFSVCEITLAPSPGIETSVTPGHPAGCCCGECEVRRTHAEDAPDHQRCEEHHLCLRCDGCPTCEIDEQMFTELRDLAVRISKTADPAVEQLELLSDLLSALEVNPAYAELYAHHDEDTDAAEFLASALRSLRAFARIARDRVTRVLEEP